MRNLAPTSTYQPRALYLHGPPGMPMRGPGAKRPPLFQFFFLSMLLHALAIMLFGAPSGGSREGRALWGSLQVVLAPLQEVQPPLRIERTLSTPRIAPSPRREPAVPPARPAAPAPPPATADPPLFVPQFLDRITAPELKREIAPPLRLPEPTQAPVAAPPPAAAPPIPAPPVVAAPVVPPPPPVVERIPVEAPPIPAPIAQPPEAPIAQPPEAPIIPEAPIVPVVPTAPVEQPPVETRAIPVPPVESVAPPRVDAPAPSVAKPMVPETPAVERAPPRIEERVVPKPIERAPPVSEPALPAPSPFRAPAPVESDRGAGSSTFDPTAPGMDLDALKKRAGQLAREGTGNRALLPFPMPAPAERKTKMETAIENARKPDCRTAYQSLGLAAVIPLIANEFGEGSCRW